MRFVYALLAAVWLVGALTSSARSAEAQPNRGETLFENRCARCHGIGGDGNEGLAPTLKGVVGRRIASRPDYFYTDAFKAKSGTWTDEGLDRFIADPQAFAPGSDMNVNSPDPAERQAIVAYLKTLEQ